MKEDKQFGGLSIFATRQSFSYHERKKVRFLNNENNRRNEMEWKIFPQRASTGRVSCDQSTSESVFGCNRTRFQPITRISDYPLHAIRKVRTSIFIDDRIWKWKLDFPQKPLSCCFWSKERLYDIRRHVSGIKFQKSGCKLFLRIIPLVQLNLDLIGLRRNWREDFRDNCIY